MKVHPVNAVFYFSPLLLLLVQISLGVAFFTQKLSLAVALGLFLLATYFGPLLVFRLLRIRSGPPEVLADFDLSRPHAWFCGIRLQIYYISLPMWEEILRWIPGAYSAWLRLWGSQIGRGVHWSPRCEVLDREQLRLGDNIQIGHSVTLTGHYIDPASDGMRRLFYKPVKIGSHSLVGGFSLLGPGVEVEPHTFIKIRSTLMKKAEL